MRVPFHHLALALSLLSSCQAVSDDQVRIEREDKPLIGGEVTEGDPAVVALTRGGSSSFCTGTLISPRVILTAAHCIDMLGNDPNATIHFGGDTTKDGVRIGVAAKKQHPMWTGNLSGGHDIGMLLMSFPYSDPTIAKELNTTLAGEALVDQDYRHVGFGVYDRATGDADGKKRQGTTKVLGVEGDVILSGDANLSVCFGDSGGPAFVNVDGEERIAGVHSYTSGQECNPPNGDTNVQIYAEDFVLPWVQDNDESCGADNLCGPIGCIDDPDCLPCGPEGTCVSDCELPDPDCQTQELGELCRANTQCLSELCIRYREERKYSFCSKTCSSDSDCPKGMDCEEIIPLGKVCYFKKDPPGVLGDECEGPADCGSLLCDEGECVLTCDLSKGEDCPDGFACETRNDADFFCRKLPDSGGCSTSGAQRDSLAYLLLLALVAMARRRRV